MLFTWNNGTSIFSVLNLTFTLIILSKFQFKKKPFSPIHIYSDKDWAEQRHIYRTKRDEFDYICLVCDVYKHKTQCTITDKLVEPTNIQLRYVILIEVLRLTEKKCQVSNSFRKRPRQLVVIFSHTHQYKSHSFRNGKTYLCSFSLLLTPLYLISLVLFLTSLAANNSNLMCFFIHSFQILHKVRIYQAKF